MHKFKPHDLCGIHHYKRERAIVLSSYDEENDTYECLWYYYDTFKITKINPDDMYYIASLD